MTIQNWSKVAAAAAVGACAWLALAAPQGGPTGKPMTSDQAFKNVRVLKGIPLDDFMGTMGVMTGSLSFDCSDCHTGAGTDNVNWAFDTPRKVTARRMIEMVATINRDNFSGRQVVTCYSCHHGRDRPLTTPKIEQVYGEPTLEMDDVLTQAEGQPAAEQIVDKYIRAIGGAEKLAGIKSYIATGTSVGFGGLGGGAKVTIYANSPDQRTLIINFAATPGRGDTTRSYDGRTGWLRTPMNVLGEYELSGGELDGARMDAEMSFPGQIKQVLTKLRVSLPTTISDLPGPSSQETKDEATGIGKDRLVDVVQGNGPRDLLVTMYFDHESGLLLRVMRAAKSPIGRVPTMIDYADYRDVNGIKMPFRMTFAWLNGRDAIRLNEVRTNVKIDPAVFGRPAALQPTGGE
ncbi:MAG TPA: photosynthetic reaction center cytochrome c subunit family protein [Bryobacteraceae bacterium]|nr:photosynthetic reaction center cytochrome c subunit family protein [Bryobacteraceae bacterium]